MRSVGNTQCSIGADHRIHSGKQRGRAKVLRGPKIWRNQLRIERHITHISKILHPINLRHLLRTHVNSEDKARPILRALSEIPTPNIMNTSDAPSGMRTTLHIDNLHSQSGVDSVTEIISGFLPAAVNDDLERAESCLPDIDVSLPEGTVSFTHPEDIDFKTVLKQLEAAGFDMQLDSSMHALSPTRLVGPSRWMSALNLFGRPTSRSSQREAVHRQVCGPCLASHVPNEDDAPPNTPNQTLRGSKSTLVGMPYRCVD